MNVSTNAHQHRDVSRRGFLTGGVAAAAVAGAAGAASSTARAASAADDPAANAGATYEVVNADLLIIGAGFGGFQAAFKAIANGKRVAIIDKGPFRHGGNAGYNWDTVAGWLPDLDYDITTDLYWKKLVNQPLYKAAVEEDVEAPQRWLEWLNRGQTLLRRDEDGTIDWYSNYPFLQSSEGVFPRLTLDELAKSPLVTAYDRTMVTDVLVNDGRCLGAIALHLPTGDYRVFRAPATILATGPTNWFYGWTGVTAYTNGSAENTGDVDMALFRHGVGIGESEFAVYDFLTTYPKGLGYGWNTSLNPDASEWSLFADKDGNPLVTEENGWDADRAKAGDRTYFNTMCGKSIAEGLGTEDGGLLCNAVYDHLRTIMKQNVLLLNDFGVDPLNEKLPIHDEIYERGGSAVIDDNLMCEGIEGLFVVRGAGAQSGANGGAMAICNARYGNYAMNRALEYLDAAEPMNEVDWEPVASEIARLEEIRLRSSDSGVRPHVVRHAIQNACGTCMGVYRQIDKLEACAAELKRIQEEDLPRQVVSSKSLTYNTEWKEAVENYNLLAAARLAVEATIMREETRGCYLRDDFPEQDDENWKVMIVGTQDTDGNIVFETREVPQLDI
jgi:succinate dehydrogenase / fumarate reductase flavoprotein subunit